MKFLSVIHKSLLEQSRAFWLFLLTVLTAPFFVLVYNLINESYKPSYDILLVNNDHGYYIDPAGQVNLGDTLTAYIHGAIKDGFSFHEEGSRSAAVKKIENKKADVLILVPGDFSVFILDGDKDSVLLPRIEFIGNITDINYIIGAIGVYEGISNFFSTFLETEPQFLMEETPIGSSGDLSDFDLAIPGLLIFSIVMLMLSASSAFVAEVENKTMQRLKLSNVSTLEFLSGVSMVQLLVGVISIILTLLVALAMGFRFEGSWFAFFAVAVLTCISIIAFSLIIAAFTKSVTQVLVVGNFPLFLFMFFTGAMFPVNVPEWFKVGDYGVSVIGLMSPTHAVSAMHDLLILKKELVDTWPQLLCLAVISIIYFSIGWFFYRRRHMK
ncbi:MAG: ABC transporter permease [Bacteroidales bacterium]|nr:ABC transporter permease [Bacteroidales bacterium]MBN2762941.1 ABC transporter permease [Bacteroidales bacterium]